MALVSVPSCMSRAPLGRDDRRAFPGLDGREPLTTQQDSFWLEFTTDSSGTDWGWKMVVTAKFPGTKRIADHWLVALHGQVKKPSMSLCLQLMPSIPKHAAT